MLLLHLTVGIAAHSVRSSAAAASARHVRRWRTDSRLTGQVLMSLLKFQEGVFRCHGSRCRCRLLLLLLRIIWLLLLSVLLLLLVAVTSRDGIGSRRRHGVVVIAAEMDETICGTGRRRMWNRRIPPDLMRRRRLQGCGFDSPPQQKKKKNEPRTLTHLNNNTKQQLRNSVVFLFQLSPVSTFEYLIKLLFFNWPMKKTLEDTVFRIQGSSGNNFKIKSFFFFFFKLKRNEATTRPSWAVVSEPTGLLLSGHSLTAHPSTLGEREKTKNEVDTTSPFLSGIEGKRGGI
jgi:hypothetical protein